MIGILYPDELLQRLRSGKPSFEKPSLYQEAAKEAGEEVIFFSPKEIDWIKGSVNGWEGPGLHRRRCPIPDVIINRMRSNLSQDKKTIKRLKKRGKVVFNEHNVYSKLKIHRILESNALLKPYLPATVRFARRRVQELLEDHSSLFLKPLRASVGNGIIRIRKVDGSAYAEVNLLGRTVRRKLDPQGKNIAAMLKNRRNYLVQQGIRLMEYKGRPVDFRVSIQKNGQGRWQCTGMVGKVGRKKSIVTNLHCGGKSVKACELFQAWGWDAAAAEWKLASLGLAAAETLERKLPHVADLGLDIAFDDEQHPWFIEANFRDLRITFRNAGERDMWRGTFAAPVHYAAYLARRSNVGKGASADG